MFTGRCPGKKRYTRQLPLGERKRERSSFSPFQLLGLVRADTQILRVGKEERERKRKTWNSLLEKERFDPDRHRKERIGAIV